MNKSDISGIKNEISGFEDKSSFSPESTTAKRTMIKARWRSAFEKIKMKKLFKNEEEQVTPVKKGIHSKANSFVHHSGKAVVAMLSTNAIAQKFAAILKKQFKTLSAKQYKIINDVCYVDVADDIKRRQKLKKTLESNFLNNADKATKREFKRQYTKSQRIMKEVIGKQENKSFELFLKPLKVISRVYLPDGLFRVTFDIFAMILIVWELIQIPILLSFQDIDPAPAFDAFSNFITSFFLTDLILNFNTAFYERGHIVRERTEIAKHYIKTWFLVDFFSSFPYDLVLDPILLESVDESDSISSRFSQSTRLFRILQFMKFFRVLRLLRAFKLKKIFGKLEDYMQLSPTLNAILALIRLSFMIICIAHWCACGFHLIATFEESSYPNTWLRQFHIEDEDWTVRYITSIYWALATMTTIGYGDITPTTNPEKIYAMLMMILSSGVFGYTMNRIGNILQSFNETSLEYKIKLFQINQYMRKKNVPKELQARVRKYLEYTLDPDKTNQIDEKILETMLSKNLQDEITVYISANIIKQYDFLYKIFSPDLLFKTSFHIHEHIYGPEEIIVSENIEEENPCIYFLTSGIVTVFIQGSNTFLNILKEGSYFGEISFFSKNKRNASIKSSDFISIYKLSRNDFWGLINNENLREDREVFCQLKDKLELYKDHLLLNLICYSCGCSGHLAKNCPEVHYIPRIDEIIKEKLSSDEKERKEYKRSRQQKFKSFLQFSVIQTSAYAIRNTMFIYHEEGLQEKYRVDADMNDFLEENPKGIEILSSKILPYKESNSFRMLTKDVMSINNSSDYEQRMSYQESEKENELPKDFIMLKKKITVEYNELWNDFDRIEIFTKYFIHNNFTIVKKRLKIKRSDKKPNKNKRQSIQKKIQLIKQKTIKGKRPENFGSDISPFLNNCKSSGNEDILEVDEETENNKIPTDSKKKSEKMPQEKRRSSLDSRKECEKFIEKHGAKYVLEIAQKKIKSLK